MYRIACDFDSVISTYERPFKYNKLGKPVKEIVDTLRYFSNKGFYIYIFTGRQYTPTMKKWLEKHKVPYDGFNVNTSPHDFESRFKPYFDIIIDDKAVSFHFKKNKKTTKELIKEIEEKVRWNENE